MLTIIALCVLIASVGAFQFAARATTPRKCSDLSMSGEIFSRKHAIKITTGLLSIALATGSVTNANAAAYFGGSGNYAEVVDPKTAVFNDETKNSDEVKAGVEGLAKLQTAVASMQASIAGDRNADISPVLKVDFSRLTLRSVLNKYNAAFSEDTQRGTDRLIRSLIQDVTELERVSANKAGKSRADSKVSLITKRLDAASASLKELAAFNPK